MKMRRIIAALTSGRAESLANPNPNRAYVRMDDLRRITEKAPPGKKAERFIKDNKAEFKRLHGDRWEQTLYAAAWQMFGDRKRRRD